MLILLIEMAFCGRCKRVNAEKVGEMIRRKLSILRRYIDILDILVRL
jgi:hypothetical protein